MKKYIKKISIFLVVTLSVLGFFVYDNWKYSKVSNAIEFDEVISLSSTYNENGEIIEVNSSNNEAAVRINNKVIIVPNDKFLEIVSKYKSKKSKTDYFPYETDKIVVMFTIVQNKEHRNFLLGDFNIWFKSGTEAGNEIIDGDMLLREILELAGTEPESNTNSVAEDIYTTEELTNLEGLTTDFSHLERVYTFNEKNYNSTMQDMIKLFLNDVLDELKQKQEDLSFQILEYQNLQIFYSTIVDGVGPQSYEPKKTDTFLEFAANVEVRYKGYISPLNYSENGTDEFFNIDLHEWVLIKDQSNYYLYPNGYYNSKYK